MQKITLRPGINAMRTPLLNEGGWSNSSLIRFRQGMPEIIGGWQSFSATLMQGVCRGMHSWATLNGTPSLGAGTNIRLYVYQGAVGYDITPVVQQTTPTNPFTTINASNIVTVSDGALTILLAVGQLVEIASASAVGGLTLNGEYTIVSVVSPTSYTIQASSPATSGATGGGTPTIQYLLQPGFLVVSIAGGWGAGTYGVGTYGTARISVTPTFPRTWTIDNFGEQMIACPFGRGIYVWLPATGTGVRAAAITNAPTQCNAAFVSNAAEQIVALGATPAGGGTFQPMLVAWCDYGNYNQWTAAVNNAAGSFPLTDGSQLMWGGRAGQQNLIWSDTALFSMQFIGGTLIYGFNQLGTGCGLSAPLGAAIDGTRAWWISGMNFMYFDGTVREIECAVRDQVFGNINQLQISKVVCSINPQFSEVRWDYPSASSNENDSYVIYNYSDQAWTIGNNGTTGLLVARTGWVGTATSLGFPVAADASGQVWQHETGYSAGGLALPWFLESGDVDIAAAEDMMFLDFIIPDQVLSGGSMGITVRSQRYSNDPLAVSWGEPFQVTATTGFLPLRLRGRQMSIRFDNSFLSVGNFWRLGAVRVRIAPDGRN